MARENNDIAPGEPPHALNQPASVRLPSVGLDSPAMRRLIETARRVGPRALPVLVGGETGVGKELIASLLHAQSNRRHRPLVRFNCAAIPGELAEAELFGHARGAFTGAVQSHR